MNKEVELTARLSKKQYERLHRFLSKGYKKTPKQKRFMVRFFKEKVDVRESLDIRYKWTNGVHELVVKKGALGSQSRQEITINLGEQDQMEHFAKLFSLMGYKTANAIYREIEKFRDKNVEVSLVTGYPYYFVEVESINAGTKNEALNHVMDFFKKVGLKPLDRAAYQAFQRLFDREKFRLSFKGIPKTIIELTTLEQNPQIYHSFLKQSFTTLFKLIK